MHSHSSTLYIMDFRNDTSLTSFKRAAIFLLMSIVFASLAKVSTCSWSNCEEYVHGIDQTAYESNPDVSSKTISFSAIIASFSCDALLCQIFNMVRFDVRGWLK